MNINNTFVSFLKGLYPIQNKIPRIEFERSFSEKFVENSLSSAMFTTYAMFKGFLDHLISRIFDELFSFYQLIN